jgi:sec-independent protein translocase protein TatB
MSFSETVFLFVLALVVFGPKKLPEIARQAGKLLAELRRASNEFKSQIETEVAHLEIQQKEVRKEAQNKQEILPPGTPPPGAVASMSLNPATQMLPLESRATLAAPAEATLAGSDSATQNLAVANVIAENTHLPSAEAPANLAGNHGDPEAAPHSAPTPQDSHV